MGHTPIFTDDELKLIKDTIKAERTGLIMRGRVFSVRYFTWRKSPWVTVFPVKGFTPMFSGSVVEVMKAEVI